MKKQLITASLLLSAATSFGGGYQLNLQGVRQMAMGGTGTAWPWDASTIFYNPGGVARLKGIQMYGSMAFIMPSTAYGNRENSGVTSSNERTASQTFTPFNFYIGGRIAEDSRFGLGLGIYTPFGAGMKWDDNWLGKYIVQSVDLQTVFFQPTVSYRASEWLSVGAGFVFAAGSVDFRQAMPIHGNLGADIDDGQAHLHGNATGVGFNIGAQMKVHDDLQFGLTYRSQVNMDVEGGSAKFTVPTSLKDSFPSTKFDARMPLPGVVSAGVGWRPLEHLTLQLDLNYTGWNSYDSLRFDFAQTTTSLHNVRAPRHYRNTLTTRVGLSYRISSVVSIMGGAAYDPTPVTNGFVSPDLPDADRVVLTCGLTVKPVRGLTIMAAFEGSNGVKRNGSYDFGGFSGVYKSTAAVPAIGLYYNF
ncbi:outer membrane protein transport protein [Nemorincola caseinilytica]|uniref:Outer membrane protein transport protein n=1 Tax=Nemorincola caseinilytica TaxID=2054315 RepID=A0ABP8NB90_9BACT